MRCVHVQELEARPPAGQSTVFETSRVKRHRSIRVETLNLGAHQVVLAVQLSHVELVHGVAAALNTPR